MSSYTLRLLKCPACGGPLDPPAGETSMKCTYCANAIIIPENLRTPKESSQSNSNIFGNVNQSALIGQGSAWGEVVQLAQNGNKSEATKKYMAISGLNEMQAGAIVDALAVSQSYDLNQQMGAAAAQAYWSNPNILMKLMSGSLLYSGISLFAGCAVIAVVVIIILIVMVPTLMSGLRGF